MKFITLIGALTLAACSSHKGFGGAACTSKTDCDTGLICTAAKVCAACASGNTVACDAGSSGGTGSSAGAGSTTPTVHVTPATGASYLGVPAAFAATVSAGATVSWAVTTQPVTANAVITGTTSATFTPTVAGDYVLTATATANGKSASATASLTVVADVFPAFLSSASGIDGHTSGIYAVSTDALHATYVLPASDSVDDQFGLTLIPGVRFANLQQLANQNYVLQVSSSGGPLAVDGTPAYNAAAASCTLGSPSRTTTPCWHPLFDVHPDLTGHWLTFLAAVETSSRSNEVFDTGGSVWAVDTSVAAPVAVQLISDSTFHTDESFATGVSAAPDGATAIVTVKQAGVMACGTAGTFATVGLAAPHTVVNEGAVDGTNSRDPCSIYARPTALPGNKVLFIRNGGPGPVTEDTQLAFELHLATAAPYSKHENQTVLVKTGPVPGYTEVGVGPTYASGITDACTAAKAAGASGVSFTRGMDYAVSADASTAVVWMNGIAYTDCTAAAAQPSNGIAARGLLVVDLTTGAVVPIASGAFGVPTTGAGGDGTCTLERAFFVSGGKQIVFSCYEDGIGRGADPTSRIYIVNTDGTGGHKIAGVGVPVAGVTAVVDMQ